MIAVSVDNESIGAERSLDTLGGIASQAKLAIANALSFTTLETTFLSTVEALANALEAKDEYTSSHARWISDMAIKVGAELGLDARALKRLELGALFHDIGKIGIPGGDPLQAWPAHATRSGRSSSSIPSSASGSSHPSSSSATSGRSSARVTSATTAAATRTGSRARRSRWRRGSSSRATRFTP